ncbi:MAG: hypothetical protein WD847_15320 [Pirellulales bacterium]
MNSPEFSEPRGGMGWETQTGSTLQPGGRLPSFYLLPSAFCLPLRLATELEADFGKDQLVQADAFGLCLFDQRRMD